MRLWPRNRVLQALLILFLLSILAVIIDQICVVRGRRITISSSTTRLTQPIDHGYPDYLAALNAAHSAGVTPDNNAAIPITQIAGTGDLAAIQIQEISRILGAPPPSNPLFLSYKQWATSSGIQIPTAGDAVITFDGFTIPANEDDVLYSAQEQARSAPWSAAQHPILTRWMKAMDPAFAKLEEACKKDCYYFPWVTAHGRAAGAAHFGIMDAILPALGAQRDMANALMADAMQRLGSGDVPGFSRDIVTGARHARLLAQQPSLIEKLVAVAIDASVEKTTQIAATSGKLPPADALALYQELDRLGPLPSPSHALDESERFMVLDAICSVNAGNGNGYLANSINTLGKFIPIDYDSLLCRMNGFYDRLKNAFDNPDYAASQATLDKVEGEVASIGNVNLSKLVHIEDGFLTMFIPAVSRVHMLATANLQERDLALIALQLRAARANNQPFPNSLATLQNIPNDHFTSQSLIYKHQADGYLLYSLGPNLKDDAGVRGKSFDKGDLSVQATQ